MGQKVMIRFRWESGLSSASRNHLTTFCRSSVHYECLRLCSAIVHFIRNNCIYFVCYGCSAHAPIALVTSESRDSSRDPFLLVSVSKVSGLETSNIAKKRFIKIFIIQIFCLLHFQVRNNQNMSEK